MSKLDFIDEKWNWKTHDLSDISESLVAWREFFSRTDIKADISDLSEKLKERANSALTIYPEIYQVFRTFSLPPEKIDLVLLGQDPYHDGNATGLCFSIPKGSKLNPSLRNIYTELKNEGYDISEDGDISYLLKNGVFMLNTALTVEKGDPESHLHLWYNFTEKVISYIAEKKSTVWLLMGAKALAFQKIILECKNHQKIFATSHPSPFSAYKSFYDKIGKRQVSSFLNSGVFREIENYIGTKLF
jgi:uracil-DNA glycosylase